MRDVGQQLFIGAGGSTVEQHLGSVSRPRPGAKHADGSRNDELSRRQIVVRSKLADAFDLRFELLDPRRTVDRLVVETSKGERRRADVAATVFQLIQRVDHLAVRREQVSHALSRRAHRAHDIGAGNGNPQSSLRSQVPITEMLNSGLFVTLKCQNLQKFPDTIAGLKGKERGGEGMKGEGGEERGR